MKVVGLFFLLVACFLMGIGYERIISNVDLENEKLTAARQQFYDWRRFTEHMREDHKAFSDKSLIFPSNVLLGSLHPVEIPSKSPLVVLQSPLDWQAQGPGYLFDREVKAPEAGQNLKMVKEGRSSSDYRLRMTVTNPGKESIEMKGFALSDSLGTTHEPKIAQASISGARLATERWVTLQLIFQLKDPALPKSVKILTSSGAMILPIDLVIYSKDRR